MADFTCLLLGVLQLLLFITLNFLAETATASSERNGMAMTPFQGIHNILEVSCSGEALESDSEVFVMSLLQKNTSRIALVNVMSGECSTSSTFSSCRLVPGNSRRTLLRTLVMNLPAQHVRTFFCEVTFLRSGESSPRMAKWKLDVRGTTTTVAPTTTTSTTTTIRPQPPSESPVASGVKSNVQEFQLPISVIIIGLVLLLFFAILCAILVILQCRGKRRRRSRAANRESLLSAKNEPMSDGGYRTPRNIPSYPPGHMPPETPGGNFAMRYQKSIPAGKLYTGYVSGSSVYYSEPYGTLDEEMKERLRPNPRMCHIPYDIKGGPLDTAHPQEHSA